MHWINSTRPPHSVTINCTGVQYCILWIVQYFGFLKVWMLWIRLWCCWMSPFEYGGEKHCFMACLQHSCNLLQHCNICNILQHFGKNYFRGFQTTRNLSGIIWPQSLLRSFLCAALCAPDVVQKICLMRLAGCAPTYILAGCASSVSSLLG